MKDLKVALRRGERIIGTFCVSNSPSIVEIIGYAGFDFVIIDCQHSATNPYGSELENMVRAAYAADITPIVRVTRNDEAQILKALDFRAKGLIVPQVGSKGEVEQLVSATHYPPMGHRSSTPVIAATKYGFRPWAGYTAQSMRKSSRSRSSRSGERLTTSMRSSPSKGSTGSILDPSIWRFLWGCRITPLIPRYGSIAPG